MNLVVRKLDGGGDTEVQRMIESATALGIDLIELVWNKKRADLAQIVGFKEPVFSSMSPLDTEIQADKWIDTTLKFYPDQNQFCWGYVFDIPENRELLQTSLSNGWFKIVDKRIRDEIVQEAQAKGLKTDITPKREVNVRKTEREKLAEKKTKATEDKLQDAMNMVEHLRKELEEAKNERKVHIERRLEGTPVPQEEINVN